MAQIQTVRVGLRAVHIWLDFDGPAWVACSHQQLMLCCSGVPILVACKPAGPLGTVSLHRQQSYTLIAYIESSTPDCCVPRPVSKALLASLPGPVPMCLPAHVFVDLTPHSQQLPALLQRILPFGGLHEPGGVRVCRPQPAPHGQHAVAFSNLWHSCGCQRFTCVWNSLWNCLSPQLGTAA